MLRRLLGLVLLLGLMGLLPHPLLSKQFLLLLRCQVHACCSKRHSPREPANWRLKRRMRMVLTQPWHGAGKRGPASRETPKGGKSRRELRLRLWVCLRVCCSRRLGAQVSLGLIAESLLRDEAGRTREQVVVERCAPDRFEDLGGVRAPDLHRLEIRRRWRRAPAVAHVLNFVIPIVCTGRGRHNVQGSRGCSGPLCRGGARSLHRRQSVSPSALETVAGCRDGSWRWTDRVPLDVARPVLMGLLNLAGGADIFFGGGDMYVPLPGRHGARRLRLRRLLSPWAKKTQRAPTVQEPKRRRRGALLGLGALCFVSPGAARSAGASSFFTVRVRISGWRNKGVRVKTSRRGE
jgi:hypothetical protein